MTTRLFYCMHARSRGAQHQHLRHLQALRRALRAAVQHRAADPLSARQGRAELQARFTRWLGDVELPELMRALDPRRSRVRSSAARNCIDRPMTSAPATTMGQADWGSASAASRIAGAT